MGGIVEGGEPMGRHRKPTLWDRIRLRLEQHRLRLVKFRRRWILRIFGR
jgi:hypothetical protein